jgi:hypothetical protein
MNLMIDMNISEIINGVMKIDNETASESIFGSLSFKFGCTESLWWLPVFFFFVFCVEVRTPEGRFHKCKLSSLAAQLRPPTTTILYDR